jgi:hypothetical protein
LGKKTDKGLVRVSAAVKSIVGAPAPAREELHAEAEE